MIHDNSTLAYAETEFSRSSLEDRIMALLADHKPRTDREVQRELEHPEPVRPRINQLLKSERIFEVGDKQCQWTGKRVRMTMRFL